MYIYIYIYIYRRQVTVSRLAASYRRLLIEGGRVNTKSEAPQATLSSLLSSLSLSLSIYLSISFMFVLSLSLSLSLYICIYISIYLRRLASMPALCSSTDRGARSLTPHPSCADLCMCIYIYIYTYIRMCVYIYIYICNVCMYVM